MNNNKTKRILALSGVAVILLLFIATIVLLIVEQTTLAITAVAINAFVTIMLYFTLYFGRSNPEFEMEKEEPSDEDFK